LKILITHGYSDSNKGDLAIVMATINAIKKYSPNVDITLHSVYSEKDPEFLFHSRFIRETGIKVEEGILPSPYIDNKPHSILRNLAAVIRLINNTLALFLVSNIPTVFKNIFRKRYQRLKTLQESDIIIAKGGQYIYNDQGGLRGFLYLWRILKPISYSIRYNKPIVLLGQSLGPLNGKIARSMVKKVLSNITLVVARERLSLDLVKSLEPNANVKVEPDMAFLIDPQKPINYNSSNLSKLDSGDWIGITIVKWYFPDCDNPKKALENYKRQIIKVVIHIKKNLKMNVMFFPQVVVEHHGESDLDLIKELVEELKINGIECHYISEDLSPAELSYLYGKCKVLLGTRLHSCILAACSGTPIVAIRYQGYKTEGVMEGLGLQEYVHDINSLDAIKINLSIENAIKNRDELSQKISSRVKSYKDSLEETIREVLFLSGKNVL